MSASSIPNLLSLRNGRGGRGGRGGAGRSRGGLSAGPSQSHDSNIQNTDTDAAVSRYSAVEAGYLDDIYASYFVSRADGPPARRFPIINRGTYTRTTALDRLIDAFLSPSSSDGSTPSQRQIISLGAGTDTRPFRLFSQPSTPHLVYHEVDFDVISKRKFQTIQGNPSLSRILTEASPTEGQTWASKPANGGEYYCHGVDLRELDKSIETPLTGLRPDVPTLLLSECCLCYLKHEEAARVVTYFTSRISNLSLIIYEPVHLDDAFGKTMVSNLAARGIRMPGLDHCRNSDDQISRLRDAGFETAKCLTVDEIWEQWVEEGEKERIHGLERLDEVEEWKLLAGHYIVVWGYKGSGLGTMSDI